MYDKELIHEILQQIHHASLTVLERFEPIKKVEDFTSSSAGAEKLDAICMQLIAIGESLKRLDKLTNGELLGKYPEIDWKGAKGMRDVISHHYFDVDAEIIYSVCQKKIGPLSKTIHKILSQLG